MCFDTVVFIHSLVYLLFQFYIQFHESRYNF